MGQSANPDFIREVARISFSQPANDMNNCKCNMPEWLVRYYLEKTRPMQLFVRDMLPSEKEAVEKLFARSLGVVDRIVFSLSFEDAQKSAKKQNGGTLVGEYDGKIVGAVSMRIQSIKGEPSGFVDALVADKEYRGKGIGTSLVANAISWLEKRGCKTIYATADRYNSPSWNTFVHKGFSVYEIPQQLKGLGLGFLRLWLAEYHFLGFGTFFLRRKQQLHKSSELGEVWHLTAAVLGVSIVWWIQPLIRGAPLLLFPLLFAVTAVSILGHELSQKLVCRKIGLQATFKAWGSGILLNLLFGLVGGFFPAFGSTYIRQIDWYYKPKDKTGIMFAVGPLVSLVFALVFWSLSDFSGQELLSSAARVGYILNLMMTVFNLLPIQGAGGFVWDGKKILNWNRKAWLLLCVATSTLVLVDIMV